MSPDECPNSSPIPTPAHLLLSSVISTSLKSFNLILILCPGEWPPPPPPPAQFAAPGSTPSPALCPSSLCLGTLKTSLHLESCLPNSCLLFLMALQLTTAGLSSGDKGLSAISWFGDNAQTLRAFFFFLPTNPNPNTSGQHQLQKILLFYIPNQSEIGLLRASNAQARESELSTSHRVKTRVL